MRQPKDHRNTSESKASGQMDNAHTESIFRQSIEQAPVGIYLADKQGNCTYANQELLNMVGLSEDAVIGEKWLNAIHPEDREAIIGAWSQVIEKGAVFDQECRLMHKNGNPVWVHALAVERSDAHGNLLGYLGINIDIHGRKQAEFSLVESERRLRLIAANIRQVIYLYDPAADQFQYISPAYESIWGEPVQSVYDDPLSFAKKVHPDDLPAFQEAVRKEHEQGIFFDLEYRIRPKRGPMRWIHSHNSPVYDQHGEHILTVGVAEDVTERRKMFETLEQEEEKFRLIADNSTEIIWQIDLKGKVTFASPSVTKITGYTREDLEGLRYRDIVSSSAVKQATKLLKAAMSGESFPLIIIDVREKDGSIAPIETSVVPVKKDGKVVAIQGIARDITQRVSAEREREALLARLSEAQQLARLGTWEWDLVNDREYWSDELFAIYGRDPKQGVPHPDDYHAQHHPQDQDKVHDALESSLSKGLAEAEYRLFRHDSGEERTIRMRCHTEFGPNKLPARQIGTVIDITDQKQRERELDQLLSDLHTAQAVSHVGSWRWNIKENFLEWSDEMYRIFGIDRDEFTGKLQDVITRAIHPDDVPAVNASNRSVIEKGMPVPLEYRVIRPDGTVRTVWAEAGQLIRDEQGKPAHLTGVVMDITERRQAEHALRESEERFRSVFEQAAVGIALVGEDARFLKVNQKFCDITGYSQSELQTRTVMDITHPDDLALDLGNIEKVRNDEMDSYQIEKRYIRKNGDPVWISLFSNVKRDADGQIEYAIAAIDDITERKRLQIKTDQLNRQLNEAQQIAHLGSWDWNPQTGTETWSDELFRIWGLEPGQQVPPQDAMDQHIHPDDRQRARDAIDASLQTGVYDIEYRIFRFDNGEERHIHAQGQGIHDETGNPIRHYGTVMDITDREKARAELARSQQQYSSLVEDSPVLISRWLADGTITFVNRAYAEFFGKPSSAFIGANIFETIAPDDHQLVRSNIAQLSPQHPIQIAENKVLDGNGELRWTRWTDRAFFDQQGKATHYQSTGIDIHDRREAEEERDRLLYTLQEAQRIAHVGSWEWDIPNDIYYWSDELFRIYGRDPHEGVPDGQEHVDVIHPDALAVMRAAKKESLVSGIYNCEYRLFRYDNGLERVVSASGEVEFDQDGHPLLQRGTLRDVTEMREAEAALKESEEQNRLLVDHAGLGIGFYDLDGVILRMNRIACKTMNTTEDQLIGKHAIEVFGKEMGSLMMDRFILAEKHHAADSYEDYVNLPDGAKWYRSTYSSVNDPEGIPIGIQIISEDITAIKQVEMELEKSQTILENFSDGVIRTDLEGNITFWNKGAQEIFGYSHEEIFGKPISILWLEQDLHILKKSMKLLRGGYDVHEIEVTNISKDQQQVTNLLSLLPLKDSRGEVIELVGFSKDISALKQTQRALEASERTLSTLMGNLPGMAYRCDNDEQWTMRFVSQGCLELTGYHPSELLDNAELSYNNIIDPEDNKKVHEQIQTALENNAPFEISYRIKCKDSSIKWVWEKGELITDPSGKNQFLEGFISDVTSRVVAEQEVRAHADFLDTIMDHSPFSMFITDPQGTIIRTNRSLREKLHLTDDQIIGKYNVRKDRNLVEQGVMSQVEAVFTHQQPCRFTIYWKAGSTDHVDFSGGADLWIDVALFPVLDQRGGIRNVVCKWVDVTAQKEYQIALETSKQQYQSVIEDSPVLISRFDPDGVITFTNSAYSQFFTGQPAGMPSANIFDFIIPSHHDSAREYLASFTPDNPVRMYDDQVKRYNGAERWLRWTDRAFFDKNGKITGYQAFGEDITAQKEYEIALKASEQHYQSVVEDSPGMILRYLPDGTITYANANYESFYGDGSQPFVGQNIYEKYSSQETAEIQDELAALTPDAPLRTLETHCVRSDGQSRWIRWTDRAIFASNGQLNGFQAFGEDITHQKQAELKLAQSEKALSTLMANLPGIAYRADAHGRFYFQFLSQGCKQLTGYEPHEFLDDPDFSYEMIMADEFIEPLYEQIKYALDHNTAFEITYRIITKDGQEKWVWERGSAVLDDAGKPHHIEGFITDITTTRELQEELRQSEDLLNTSQRLSKAGGWMWDIPSQSMHWTEETYRIHDLAPEDVGTELDELVERSAQCYHPSGRAEVLAAFHRCLDEGQPYDLELPFTTTKGRRIWVRTTGQPVYRDANIIGAIGNIIDISEQKAVEERILHKAQFEQLLSRISASMLEGDIGNIDAKVNDALKQVGELLDLDRISLSTIIGGESMSLTHTWSRKRIKGTRVAYQLDQYPWMFSTLSDGNIKVWSLSEGIPSELTDAERQLFVHGGIQSFLGIPIHLHQNRLGGLAFSDTKHPDRFTQDMIESLRLFAQIIGNALSLRDAQYEIAESEARFRAFMDNFPANAYIKDADGKHVFVNRATSDFSGIPQDEYVGKKTGEVYPAELAAELDELDQSVITDQVIIEKEDYYTSKSGQCRFQRDIKFPIQGPRGEKLVGGIALDLTAQNEAEQRILAKAEFEQQLAALSTAFLTIDTEEFDKSINNSLERVAKTLHIDRIVITQVKDKKQTLHTHVYSKKKIKGVRKEYDLENYPWLFKTPLGGESIVWSRKDGFQENLTRAEIDFFETSKIQSLVSLPIRSAGILSGSIIFSDFKDPDKFTPDLVESLNLFSQIISNAITLRDAQRELMGSEQRYRSVVNDSPILINRYLPDGTQTFSNPAYREFFGKSEGELNGIKIFELMPKDSRAAAKRRLADITKENPFYTIESKAIRADGQIRWLRWTVRALLDQSGEIGTIQSFGIDITEQRLTAERVAASERKYRSLFSEMANGFSLFEVIRDKKGQPENIAFVEVNPAFEKITGLKQDQVAGKPINAVLPNFDPGWVRDYIDVALHDTSFVRKDFNQRLGIHTEIRAFSPREGQCAVLLTDITEQENLYHQIEQERDRAQHYLDTVQSIMIVMDEKGHLTLVNRKACQILGYTEEELLGKNWFDTCLPTDNRKEVKQVFKQIVEGKVEAVEYYENPVQTRTGERRIIAWHNTDLKDTNGKLIGVLSSGEDITARKAAQDRVQTLLGISAQLIAESYDQDVLQDVANEVRSRIDAAQAVTIWLYKEDAQQLAIHAVAGFEDQDIIGLTIDAEQGVAGQVAATRQPRLVHHAQQDKTFTTVGGFTPEMMRIQCLMCAPLIIKDKLLGVICVDNFDAPEALTVEDLNLVESIANQLAGIVDNALLFEQLQQSQAELRALSKRLLEVHEKERRAVALDLHDHFGQILTTFKLSLRPEAFIKHNEEEQRARLAEVTEIVDELMSAAEDLSLRLRPSILDDLGLTNAFEWHIGRFIRQTNIPVETHISIEKGKRFDEPIEITLYRVMEEGLSNALQHGNPTRLQVDLHEQEQHIVLKVQDNGSGFDFDQLDNANFTHTGLIGMQERVNLINGSIQITSQPAKGTTIQVKIPKSEMRTAREATE